MAVVEGRTLETAAQSLMWNIPLALKSDESPAQPEFYRLCVSSQLPLFVLPTSPPPPPTAPQLTQMMEEECKNPVKSAARVASNISTSESHVHVFDGVLYCASDHTYSSWSWIIDYIDLLISKNSRVSLSLSLSASVRKLESSLSLSLSLRLFES